MENNTGNFLSTVCSSIRRFLSTCLSSPPPIQGEIGVVHLISDISQTERQRAFRGSENFAALEPTMRMHKIPNKQRYLAEARDISWWKKFFLSYLTSYEVNDSLSGQIVCT